jgi:hypothetical protein
VAGYTSTEALLINWVTGLGYTQVTDELPDNLVDLIRTAPVVIVERFGGADTTITLDVARVDIDVYANSREGALGHAETIRAAARARLRGYTFGGAVVGRVETISAPRRALYDSRSVVRRFTAAYQITTHHYVGVS